MCGLERYPLGATLPLAPSLQLARAQMALVCDQSPSASPSHLGRWGRPSRPHPPHYSEISHAAPPTQTALGVEGWPATPASVRPHPARPACLEPRHPPRDPRAHSPAKTDRSARYRGLFFYSSPPQISAHTLDYPASVVSRLAWQTVPQKDRRASVPAWCEAPAPSL